MKGFDNCILHPQFNFCYLWESENFLVYKFTVTVLYTVFLVWMNDNYLILFHVLVHSKWCGGDGSLPLIIFFICFVLSFFCVTKGKKVQRFDSIDALFYWHSKWGPFSMHKNVSIDSCSHHIRSWPENTESMDSGKMGPRRKNLSELEQKYS